MTGSDDRKRAAVMRLIRKGLLTPDEAAGLTSTPKDLVEYWALCEGIDIATARAIYLLEDMALRVDGKAARQYSTAQDRER